jgi:hypothetical protein
MWDGRVYDGDFFLNHKAPYIEMETEQKTYFLRFWGQKSSEAEI